MRGIFIQPIPAGLVIVSLVATPLVLAQKETIPEGAKVRVRLDQQLSSETAKVGDRVRLSILDDIGTGEKLLVARDTPVKGTVTSVARGISFGRSGKVDFSIDTIVLSGGDEIPVRYSKERVQGASRVRTGIILYGLIGIAGPLLLNGHEATVYEGAVYEVYTDSAYTFRQEYLPSGLPRDTTSEPVNADASYDATAIGVIYLLNPESKSLVALNDEPWISQPAGDEGTIQVVGAGSATRLSTDRPEFVFKIGNPENAKMYAFNITSGKKGAGFRWFSIVHKVGKKKETSPGLPVEITRIGISSFKLVSKQPLPPGEYAIALSGSKLFSFGIDLSH